MGALASPAMPYHAPWITIPFAAAIAPWLPNGSGWIGNWTPGIGDPSFLGWFTVVAYFVAAVDCWRVRNRIRAVHIVDSDRECRIWTALGLSLLFLCANKQLDLQTAFTETVRQVAKHQGWYEIRAKFQILFIGTMALCLPVGAWVVFRLARGLAPSFKIVGLGLVLLGVFILIRAASFHHVDRLLSRRFANFKVNWILELGGIGVVLAGTRKRAFELRRSSKAVG